MNYYALSAAAAAVVVVFVEDDERVSVRNNKYFEMSSELRAAHKYKHIWTFFVSFKQIINGRLGQPDDIRSTSIRCR